MDTLYLRISVTDRCNYACRYCIPKSQIRYIPHEEILTYEEIEKIVSLFLKIIPISSIRLTGGEPLLRKGIENLVRKLKALDIKDVSITTNGYFLKEKARVLKEAGLDRINVSLDTLNKEKYKHLTTYGDLSKVLEGLFEAKRYFSKIKLNTVLIKGFTEEEIDSLLRFAAENNFEIRFIELMDIGLFNKKDHFLPVEFVKSYIEKKYGKLISLERNSFGPAERYFLKSLNLKLGFIPTSHNFCKTCNRLRLSADGKIRLCLLNDLSYNLKPFLRGAFDENKLLEFLKGIIKIKESMLLKLKKDYCKENMVRIGG